MKNIYYFHTISKIGGIETFFFQLAKKYKNYDLTIFYRNADPTQLERLKKYVRCIQFTGQKIKCEKAFFNFNTDIIDNVEAKEYCLVIHGDYKDMIEKGQLHSAPNHPKITKYYGVSKKACDSFTEVTGLPCELCYNPFISEAVSPALRLISATRLTKEKGFHRMKRLAQRLDERNIPFLWLVFTNTPHDNISKNMIYMDSRLDIKPFIASSDFLIQLSDNEGYCYSVVEAWDASVPVVITPLPVLKEIGATEDNSIFFDFDTSNIDEVIDKMLSWNSDFTYIPKQDNWENLLLQSVSTYEKELNTLYQVQALTTYEELGLHDKELGYIPKNGECWTVTKERLDVLMGGNAQGHIFVKLLKEIPKTSN